MQNDITPRRKTDSDDQKTVDRTASMPVAVQEAPRQADTPQQVDAAPSPPDQPVETVVAPSAPSKKNSSRKPVGVIIVALLMCGALIGLIVYSVINKDQAAVTGSQVSENVYTSAGRDYLPEVVPLTEELQQNNSNEMVDLSADLSDESLGL